MPTVIIPPTDVSPNTGSGSEVLATDPVFPNNITVNGTTDSSSKDTGAIVTEGGLGVEKSASIGGNLTVSGTGGISRGFSTGAANTNGDISLTINGNASIGTAARWINQGSSAANNWQIGTNLTGNWLSFMPSTAADGTTFSTDAFKLTPAGNATLAGNVTASGGSVLLNALTGNPPQFRHHAVGTADIIAGVNGIRFLNNAASAAGMSLDANNDTTFTGNLTVSGTGTSSVAGNLNIGEPTGSGYRLYVKAGFGFALGGSYIECGEYDKPCSILNHTNPAVSANLFQIQKQGTGVFTVSSAGNLTVSGTGTSSVAGSFGIGTTALSSYGGVLQVKGRQAWLPSTWTNSSTNYLAWMNVDDSTNTFYIQTLQNNGTNSGSVSIQPNGGNVLIGTTTDGGQKLQVSGTAAISGGIVGTTTNDSAAAGIVGQYVSSTVASGSAVSLSNGTAANVTSISLTAGDWDVSAKVGFKPNVFTTISYMLAAVSDTSAATTEANRIVLPLNGATTAYNVEATVPTVRISIASTTTIYLVASSEFAVSTQSAFGTIIARRVR